MLKRFKLTSHHLVVVKLFTVHTLNLTCVKSNNILHREF